MLVSASMSQGRPAKWTGRMARVFLVILRSICLGSMFWVPRSQSTRTGLAPACRMALSVAQKVIGVVMTSSPGLRSSAARDRCRAAVQELTATACLVPL